MKNFEFSVLLFFEKIPKWRGWKDIFYEDDVIHAEQISRTLSFFFLFFFFFYILLTCYLYTPGPQEIKLIRSTPAVEKSLSIVTWPEMELENVEVGDGRWSWKLMAIR